MKENILITGATGFLGRHFISDYKDIYSITSVDLKCVNPQNIDFTGISAVLHCAALVHQKKRHPESLYFEINTNLSISLAQVAKASGVKKFIFISSVAVYGELKNPFDKNHLLDEDSPCNPTSSYGKSKLAAEIALLSMANENFNVTIIRPPMVYGPNCKGNPASLFKLVRYSPALPFNYNNNARSMVFVKNLTSFIHQTIQANRSGVFIAQDKNPVSIKDLILMTSKALNKRVWLFSFPPFLHKTLCYIFPQLMNRLYGSLVFNSEKSNAILNFTPTYSTTEGISVSLRSKK